MKWVVMDSNHRRQSQQIYSLPHLATLVTTLTVCFTCSSKANAKIAHFGDKQAQTANDFQILTFLHRPHNRLPPIDRHWPP